MEESIKIFLSYAREDRETVKQLYNRLLAEGFHPWMYEKDVLPGEKSDSSISNAIRNATMFLACLSKNTISSRGRVQKEIQAGLNIYSNMPMETIFLIPVLLEPCEIPDDLIDIEPVYLYEDDGFHRLLTALKKSARHLEASISAPTRKIRNLVITEVELTNIRCFKKLQIRLEKKKNPVLWLMVLGDNAAGKTTFLRSIALGLCNESDAIALMKEVQGGFVRKSTKEGIIKLRLVELNEPAKKYTITTRISKKSPAAPEIVRQELDPVSDFPWDDIFVCGYGTHRSAQAYTSYENYTVLNAVRSLFDYQVSLQNPEVVLLRRDQAIRNRLEKQLLKILMLDAPDNTIHYPTSGFEVTGPWGQLPLQVLSDGYRSTAQWVLDFIGWSIYAGRLVATSEVGGILLIDEIEQHLHPRWQRYIVQRLRNQFPITQVIASSHTPLTASGIADIDNSLLLKLNMEDDGTINEQTLDKKLLDGKRADQVLASEAFGLYTTRNPGSENDIDRYARLLGQTERTKEEEVELQTLRKQLQEFLQDGETELERKVKKAVDNVLQDLLENVDPELIDLEVKKQLQEILKL